MFINISEKDAVVIIIPKEGIKEITFDILLFIIILGTLGGIGNIIIFTSKKLRYNSCGFYFLCSTIFDLMYLLFGGITRLMKNYIISLLSNESVLFCKCRTYLVVVIPLLSMCFLMLATIDRCLSTSTLKKWRHLSNINTAWRIAILTLILSLLSTSHILFFYELERKDVNNNVYKCIPHRGIYTTLVSYLFSIHPFVIYTIMLICTVITLRRIRRSRYRLKILYNQRRSRRSSCIDRHLITIVFVQVGLGMLLTYCRCTFLIYSFWTNNITKSHSTLILHLFLDQISLIIYYMNFAKSFPLNILTSQLFRQIFYQQISNFIKWISSFPKEESSINSLIIKQPEKQVRSSDG